MRSSSARAESPPRSGHRRGSELVLKHDEGLLPKGGEGRREGDWILLDYLDCVLHVFTPEARTFYRLEQLWGQVPQRQVV